MSDSVHRTLSTVGVVGPGAESIADLVAAAGGDSLVGDAETVLDADPDAVVAVGERAARDVAVDAPELPVLAVDGPAGVPSVPREDCPDAIEALFAGEWSVRRCPTLTVTAEDATTRALLDASLMTSAPARISEYGVESEAIGTVDTFRSDGVVVATPAGSHGYARSAGGPTLAPDVEAAVVVPVAPFAIEQDRWVLDLPVTLSVERDESSVELYVDGELVRDVGTETPVAVRQGTSATFVGVAECGPLFG